MNNQNNLLALDLVRHSRRIVAMLEQNIPLDEVIVLMVERDALVAAIDCNDQKITEADLVLELIQLRQTEAALLEPHMQELSAIKQSLININHLGKYIVNGL